MIAETNPTPIAVIYARYSPRNERSTKGKKYGTEDRQRNSCDVQIADLLKFCDSRGYITSEQLIFRDDCLTGTRMDKRPGWAACKAALKRGMILVVREIKRIGRTLEAFDAILRLDKRGVHIETQHDGVFDGRDPNKLMLFGIKVVMGMVEARQSSIVTGQKQRHYQNVERRIVSRIIPYGWQRDPERPTHMIANPGEQAVIERIAADYSAGLSTPLLKAALEAEGTLCRGTPWNLATIAKIVRRAGIKVRKPGRPRKLVTAG